MFKGEAGNETTGTAVLVANEYAITAAHVLPKEPEKILKVTLYSSNNMTSAIDFVTSIDWELDAALIRVEGAEPAPAPTPIKIRSEPIDVGEQLTVFGFRGALQSFTFQQGSLVGRGGPKEQWIADIPSGPGASGAPALDLSGKLAGIVTGVQFDSTLGTEIGTMITPVSDLGSLLDLAGL